MHARRSLATFAIAGLVGISLASRTAFAVETSNSTLAESKSPQAKTIDKVKIDIAFVRNITGELEQATIAQTIIHMAHSLNLKCIAEGVETTEQREYLRHHGCDEIQGYLVSRPLPLEHVQELLINERVAMEVEFESNVAISSDSLATVPSGRSNGSSSSNSVDLGSL